MKDKSTLYYCFIAFSRSTGQEVNSVVSGTLWIIASVVSF